MNHRKRGPNEQLCWATSPTPTADLQTFAPADLRLDQQIFPFDQVVCVTPLAELPSGRSVTCVVELAM